MAEQPPPDDLAAASRLAERGRYEEALEVLRALVAREPEHVAALAKLGGIEARSGDLDAAQEHLEHALSLDQKYGAAWSNLGNVAYERKDYAEAERCYQKALEVAPGDPIALNNLAAVYKRRGNITGMVSALKRSHRAELQRPDRRAPARGGDGGTLPRRGALGCLGGATGVLVAALAVAVIVLSGLL